MKEDCRIILVDHFRPFRDRPVFGLSPMIYLKNKLERLQIRLSMEGRREIPEDAFYLGDEDLMRLLQKRPGGYTPVEDEYTYYKALCEIKKQINVSHLRNQVRILNIDHTYIDANAVIGKQTVIYPGTYIEGDCSIGEGCVIGPDTRIVDSKIQDHTAVVQSVILESVVGKSCEVGPFAYIRPETVVEDHVKVGNFVEIKKTRIQTHAKIPHLAYIGDAQIGRNTNIACGVITANYDGKEKHMTLVGDHSFVGCNVTLVAPVEVSSHSYIAAGSTITRDVPEDTLAIARERQLNKEGWVSRTGRRRKEK